MKKIISLILTIVVFGCTNLDEKVYSNLAPANYYNSVADANAGVIAVYNAMNRSIGLWDFGMSSLSCMASPYALSRVVPWRTEFSTYQVTPSSGVSLPWVWDAWYKAVFRSNVAIKEIESRTFADAADDKKRVQLLAEAKWLRAYVYFNLVQLWGDVPMPLEPATDEASAKQPGTPKAKIYEQIIADLLFAEANLPTTRDQNDKGRPIVGTAKFLLAKVYLTMAGNPLNDKSKYQLAYTKIKEVIDNAGTYGYSLTSDYESIFRTKLTSEVIFAIQQSRTVTDQGHTTPFVWGGPNWPAERGPFGGQYHGGYTKAFYDSFGATDVRRDVTMAYTYVGADGDTMIYGQPSLDTNGDGKTSGWWGIGYDVDKVNGIAPNKYWDAKQQCCDGDPDIMIYRYSDALLMFAELENELNGPTSTAFQYLNMVRARAKATTYISGSATKDQFRELIYKERYWEFTFEFQEIYDIRRLGKVAEVIAQSEQAQRAKTIYKPAFLLWPIPIHEINANPNLKQNPGY